MIAILQPFIPHYREEFFTGLGRKTAIDIYCYENQDDIGREHFHQARVMIRPIGRRSIGPFLFYNPFTLLNKRYDVLVLMLNFTHLSTWLLLLTQPLHRKKIILWGHGISIKRFKKEERRPHLLLRWMIALAGEVWFYTDYELNIWRKIFPKKPFVSLNNTISGIRDIMRLPPADKSGLKQKHGIRQDVILIFCARFNTLERRTDILEKAIAGLDEERYGFIIIGDGPFKPDFGRFKNVYDFGSVYDRDLKNDLFRVADIYFQPAWLGLSVTEALAYEKPIYTFERTGELLQCVEYSYLIDGYNGAIARDFEQFIRLVSGTTRQDIDRMSANCKAFTETHLTMEHMIDSAYEGINQLI